MQSLSPDQPAAAARPLWAQGLEGKTAVVTGASRGIGRAIARALADSGAHVVAVARNRAALDELAAGSERIEAFASDVGDPAFPAALAAREIDILINNAGTNAPMAMSEVPVAVLDDMLSLNVRSAFLVAQAVVRSMLSHGRGGSIIHISSQMGHVGSPKRTVYCMTKHALEGLSKAMAVELAPRGIRVNTIAPTFIDTEWTSKMFADPEFERFVFGSIPLGRLGKLDEVAAAAVYLASPAAAMITGTSLVIDGGWTAR